MNKLYYGDNLDVLRRFVRDETVDLCYIDPPFYVKDVVSAEMNSEAKYKAVTERLKQTIQRMLDEMRSS